MRRSLYFPDESSVRLSHLSFSNKSFCLKRCVNQDFIQITRRSPSPMFGEGSGPVDYICCTLTFLVMFGSLVFYIWLYRSLLRSGKAALASTPFANEDTLGLTPKAVVVGLGKGIAGGVKATGRFIRSPRSALTRSKSDNENPKFLTSSFGPSQPSTYLSASASKSFNSYRLSAGSPTPTFNAKGISVRTSLHTYDDRIGVASDFAMEMGELPMVLDFTPNAPRELGAANGDADRRVPITRPPPGLTRESLSRMPSNERPSPNRI